jgi:hypothetical protein
MPVAPPGVVADRPVAADPRPSVSRGNSRSYLALGMTFLLLGLGFANPFPLVLRPPAGIWEGNISLEALNLYALTAFLGWAHFAYAWQGQWKASLRVRPYRRAGYWVMIAMLLMGFLGLRSVLGVGLFSLLIWGYNISHFIKAEAVFSGRARSQAFLMPTIAFAWFTLVLFPIGPLGDRLLVFAGTALLAAAALYFGAWRDLAEGRLLMPLLSMFLLGETLVWSGYSPYMSPAFRVGVYIFHIAAASFFHYLSSYFFAQRGAETPRWLRPGAVVVANLALVGLGCAVARVPAFAPLRYIVSPEWFTLWVALHLAASDLLPWWKQRAPVGIPA